MQYKAPGLFIDGKELFPAGNPMIDVIDPATEEVLGTIPTAGPAEVAAALAAAERGLLVWRNTPSWERGRILHKIADLMRERVDLLGELLSREIGKTFAEGKGEVMGSADYMDWYAEEARRLHTKIMDGRVPGTKIEILHEPIGVVLALSAWNFPVNLSARKLAMALAAGCSAIVRPAEEGPGCTAALVNICYEAGVPKNVISLIYGPPEATVGPLMAAPSVRAVSFTGSTRVGKLLIEQSAPTVKRLMLELGGHAPFIVLEDADVDKAAAMAVAGKFRNAGQVCTSPSRFLVHESLAKPFAEKMAAGAKALKVGPGMAADTQMGPLATSRQRDRAERLVADARSKGATILTGGSRPSSINHGYFFEPTVMTNVPDNAAILTEEPFCPVASVIPVRSTDEAIKRANSLEAGLAGYVFTRSDREADRVTSQLEAGVIGINTFAVATAEAPFGGVKQSGIGREGGGDSLQEFLNPKFRHRFPG